MRRTHAREVSKPKSGLSGLERGRLARILTRNKDVFVGGAPALQAIFPMGDKAAHFRLLHLSGRAAVYGNSLPFSRWRVTWA